MQLVLRYTTSYMCPRTASQVSPSSVRQGVYWAAYSEYLYQRMPSLCATSTEYSVRVSGTRDRFRAQNTPISTPSLYANRIQRAAGGENGCQHQPCHLPWFPFSKSANGASGCSTMRPGRQPFFYYVLITPADDAAFLVVATDAALIEDGI